MSAGRRPPGRRADYAHFHALATRWMDNDQYGHVNNAVYYAYFDTAVNAFLISRGVLDPQGGATIGLVVESGCRYHAPLAFPERVTAGLRTGHVGRSSVRYEVGLFREDEDAAAAEGHFVHVYVDRAARRPVELPPEWREALAALHVDAPLR